MAIALLIRLFNALRSPPPAKKAKTLTVYSESASQDLPNRAFRRRSRSPRRRRSRSPRRRSPSRERRNRRRSRTRSPRKSRSPRRSRSKSNRRSRSRSEKRSKSRSASRSRQVFFNIQGVLLSSATCLQKTGSETGFLAQNLDSLFFIERPGVVSVLEREINC